MLSPSMRSGVAVSDPAFDPALTRFLEQLDLLSFLSNHSYLITRRILEAAQASLDQGGKVIPITDR